MGCCGGGDLAKAVVDMTQDQRPGLFHRLASRIWKVLRRD